MSEAHYSPLVPDPMGISHESSHERLLPTGNMSNNIHKFSYIYTITFNAAIALRVLSTILALISFIILVIHGNDEFIAADIFLMAIINTNILNIARHFMSHVLTVTVEIRSNQRWKGDVGGQTKSKITLFLDIAFSSITLLCLIIGHAVKDWGHGWEAGVAIGYIVILLQAAIVVPTVERKTITLTAKVSDYTGKVPADTKDPPVVDETERGSARRRATDSEEPRSNAEDLV